MIGYDFTKQKFLKLPIERQHKKCAEVLRQLYEMQERAERDTYTQIAHWMDLASIELTDTKQVSDRYHWHLNLAKISHKEHRLLPKIRQGDREKGEVIWQIAIYLDKLRSAHNIGSILRTVEAMALGSVYFSQEMAFITHPQVQKASMGTFQWISCHQGVSIEELPRPIIVMETADMAQSIYDFTFPEQFTLVVGNEEYGCSSHTLKKADHLIQIPLRGRKNSLNVANAFAIAASEIQRQKSQLTKG